MSFKPSLQQLNRTYGSPKTMEISKSIVVGLIVGSQMPADSPENRAWNRAFDRLYLASADFVIGYVGREFPYLNHADAQDILMDTLVRLRRNVSSRSKRGDFDPEQVNLEPWMIRICNQTAIDLIRKARKRKGEFSIDAPVLDEEEGHSFHDVHGEEDIVMQWWIERNESAERRRIADELIALLEESGKRTPESIAIFVDTLNGDEPEVVAARHGVSRGAVDTLKREMIWQLNQILMKVAGGMAVSKAIKSTPAKPPKKTTL